MNNDKQPHTNKRSTIVRTAPQRMILSSIELISKINPMLGADLSLNIFTTPILKKNQPHLYPKDTRQKSIKVLGKKVVVHKYGTGARKILLIHGWEGAASDFSHFFGPLQDEGFQVIAIDLPGHGDSPRARLNAAEAAEIIAYMELIHGPFTAIIGHSFGAFSTGLALSKYSELKDIPFISIGAPNKLKSILHSFSSKLRLSHLQEHYLLAKLETKYDINANEFQFSNFIKEHIGPILIMHDENDKQVPISTIAEIEKDNKSAQYIKTKKLGHNRILKDPNVINDIIDFIQLNKDKRFKFQNAFKYGLI